MYSKEFKVSRMNQQHRERIDFCHNEIVSKIDLIKLLPKLIEHKVYDRDDVNMTHWMSTITKPETISDVYRTIKTRGPHAFENLLLSLRETGHENLADILEGNEISNNNNAQQTNASAHLNINDNFHNLVQEATKPLEINVRKASTFKDEPDDCDVIQRYPMRSKPHGLVLLISNIDFLHLPFRSAAVHDENNLQTLFKDMGFKVILHHNQTAKEMMEQVREFSKLKELRNVHSAFVIITSHGMHNIKHNETEIQGVNDAGMSVDHLDDHSKEDTCDRIFCRDILNCFTSEACPDLADKPKVFIFQICRGREEQKAIPNSRLSTDAGTYTTFMDYKILKTTRNHSDVLIVHSTLPGYVAFRDNIVGSWFIQILCEVFMNHAWDKHLEDLLTMVDNRLSTLRGPNNKCQTVHRQSIGFNKHCYLNPGLFQD